MGVKIVQKLDLANPYKESLPSEGFTHRLAVHRPIFLLLLRFELSSPAMYYAPAQDVQRPTHPRLHVRDARDAHTVFEAVRLGVLKPVVRRLNELERSSYIQSGSIFIWEESDDEMGLKRWTDGKVQVADL